jgi:hypothetical protein
MSNSLLLSELKEQGITLQAHGNRLRYRPRSAVGPELLALLQKHKADIIRIINLEAEDPKLPSEFELQSRGTNILRNHAVARARIELADAADAWDRMHEKIKNRRK